MLKIKTIRQEGGSRVLAVTDFIPADWRVVTVVNIKRKDKLIIVTLERVK